MAQEVDTVLDLVREEVGKLVQALADKAIQSRDESKMDASLKHQRAFYAACRTDGISAMVRIAKLAAIGVKIEGME